MRSPLNSWGKSNVCYYFSKGTRIQTENKIKAPFQVYRTVIFLLILQGLRCVSTSECGYHRRPNLGVGDKLAHLWLYWSCMWFIGGVNRFYYLIPTNDNPLAKRPNCLLKTVASYNINSQSIYTFSVHHISQNFKITILCEVHIVNSISLRSIMWIQDS